MSPIQAIVFDLDGTLIDSAPEIGAALNQLLGDHGLPPLRRDQIVQLIGDGAPVLVRRAFEIAGTPLTPENEEGVIREYLDRLAALPALPESIYPGVAETLPILAEAGFRMGVCTNKPERITRQVLDQLGLARFFSALAGGDTLPVRKPDGRHLGWVVRELGASASAAVMVGDNANDMRAARDFGVPAIAVSYGYPRMPIADLGADLVIDRFDQLPAALERLAAEKARSAI